MKKGKLTFYYGPMFSGKTLTLINKILELENTNILVFKPKSDIRTKEIYSRANKSYKAIEIEKSEDILKYINSEIENIFIDEIQFFDKNLINIIEKVLNLNINIFCSGLDRDYKSEFFYNSKKILELTKNSLQHKGICYSCKKPSTRTIRKINGEITIKDSPEILVEVFNNDNVEYFPVCKDCHPIKK